MKQRLLGTLTSRHECVASPSWDGFLRLVRERPLTEALLDLSAIPPRPSLESAVFRLRRRFPHLGLVLLVPRQVNPFGLFQLGKAGIQNLFLLGLDDPEVDLARALGRARAGGATSLVTRYLSPYLATRELQMAVLAMDSVHKRWTADEFAGEVGITRPFLSERFKRLGLPSVGHFLLWVRLLHAGHWLEEPGRTGESVGRQLEYSSGAAFRRALKHYTGATPTAVREGGGLRFVFREFLRRSRLGGGHDPLRGGSPKHATGLVGRFGHGVGRTG